MKLGGWTILSALLCWGCGDDAGPASGASDSRTVANALTRGVTAPGGTVEPGILPAPDDDGVRILPLIDAVLMSPGQPTILPFNVVNPDGSDGVQAMLLQFGSAKDHLKVPLDGTSGSTGDFDNPLEVSESVCKGLCARRYVVKVFEVLELESGKHGKHAERTVVLDCRGDAEAVACEGDESAGLDASVGVALDAAVPGPASTVRMDVLDAVKAVCACDATYSGSLGLLCVGTLAASSVPCHTTALDDYASASAIDLACVEAALADASACLAACGADAGVDCTGALAACGFDLAGAERALLSCETFTCADGGGRIDGSRLCDGTPDCTDGSDEASPNCG